MATGARPEANVYGRHNTLTWHIEVEGDQGGAP
jgi:hypothetical protein